ncbi:hypothetical protein A3E76_04215 [Candidatus Saccharibacteria bacterium RIFCSPHIGHO2_12_FULL_44_22]|nr:MAG: hypothetical protein A3E76_04215 [Candidatus Saccharibacteria bacterium RIFCSPHIGHO2_12_FULL_44_22]
MDTFPPEIDHKAAYEKHRVAKSIIAGIAAISLSACTVEARPAPTTPETSVTAERIAPIGEVGKLSFEDIEDTPFSFDTAQASVTTYPDQFTQLINPNPNDPANPYKEDHAYTASLLEVTYVNGKLEYSDVTIGQTLENAPKQQLIDAVAVNHELLESAFKNDSLDIINFRIVKDDPVPRNYSLAKPQYVAEDYMNADGGGVIYMAFDSYDIQTVADIATMLRHETLHSLTATSDLYHSNNEAGYSIDADTLYEFSNACRSLRSLALNQVATNSAEIVQQLESVAASVSWQYSAQIQAIIQSIQDGSIANIQPAFGNQIVTTTSAVQECVTLPPKNMLLYLMRSNGIDTESFYDSMPRQARDQLALTINSWGDALRDQTFYRAIRESPYLEEPMIDELEGHPWDGWEELIASMLNVALTFPDEFVQNYHNLTSGEQTVIKNILRLNATEFEQLHPELADYHTQLDNLIGKL